MLIYQEVRLLLLSEWQYLKKRCDFSDVTDDDLITIMDKLNNRLRKSLSYATPNEIFK